MATHGIDPQARGLASRLVLNILAGLVPAANKMIYFTSASAAALTDLVSQARSFLADPSAAYVNFAQSGTGGIVATLAAWLGRRPIDPASFGAVGDGVTNDATALTNAFAAAAAAGVSVALGSGKNYKINSAVSLPAGLTVFGYGATVTVAAAITGFTTAASNVTVAGVKFAGPSSTYNATSFAFTALGVANGAAVAPTYINNIRLIDCTAEDFGNSAFRLEYVDGFLISNPTIRRVGYWMILTISAKNGTGVGGLFDTVTGYDSTPDDAEGGAITWSSIDTSTDYVRYPSSEACVWYGGVAKNIPTWTAYDTHGGVGCGFVGSHAYDCRRAVWLTSRNGRGPKKCFATGIYAVNTFAEHAQNSNGSTKRDTAFLIFGYDDTNATTRASDCHIEGTCIGFGYGGRTGATAVIGAVQLSNTEQSCSVDAKIINPFGAGLDFNAGARGTVRAQVENPQSSGTSGSTVAPRYVNISATGTSTVNVTLDNPAFIRSNAALNTYVGTRAIVAGGGETLANMVLNFMDLNYDTNIDMTVSTNLGTVRGGYPLSYTADVVGLAFTETATVIVQKMRDEVQISLPFINDTSDTTTFILGSTTPLPVYARPANTQYAFVRVLDNSNPFMGLVEVGTGGIMTLYSTVGSAGWTASGTKRLYRSTITFSTVT